MARGWSSARPVDEVVLTPQSDGGPGFVDCLAGVGRTRSALVSGPLGDRVTAQWRIAAGTAYLESAQACGLHLVNDPGPGTALAASSRGVGELIAAALARDDVRRLIVGLGGSATTDGGRGMLEAFGGFAAAERALRDVAVLAATDVDNPLTGPRGAAAVFAPQKGADPDTVAALERRLETAAEQYERWAGRPVAHEPGAGAAGGIGAALLALGGRRVSGADLVAAATGLPGAVRGADVVLTGEGRLDDQTAGGKVVARVAAMAAPGTAVLALVGDCLGDRVALSRALGLRGIATLVDHVGLGRAVSEPDLALVSLAARVAAGLVVDDGRIRE